VDGFLNPPVQAPASNRYGPDRVFRVDDTALRASALGAHVLDSILKYVAAELGWR
jgi:hypothetical protein